MSSHISWTKSWDSGNDTAHDLPFLQLAVITVSDLIIIISILV